MGVRIAGVATWAVIAASAVGMSGRVASAFDTPLLVQELQIAPQHVVVDGLTVSATNIMVQLRRGVSPTSDDLLDVLGEYGATARYAFDPPPADALLAARCGLDRTYRVDIPFGTDIPTLLSDLRGLGTLVEWAEPDVLRQLHTITPPNDPLFTSQWYLQNTGQQIETSVGVAGADARAAQAWVVVPEMRQVVVAVIDTGVSQSHPEFSGLLLPGRNFLNSNTPTQTDDDPIFSHGTFVSGILAAKRNNLQGIAGVAPNVLIMPIKVASASAGPHSATSNGLIWAADNGAQIASMSLGFQTGTQTQIQTLQNAMIYARDRGVLMVASTGNDPGALVGYPARWGSVIAVGGTNNQDAAFEAGTTGPEMDLSAPGDLMITAIDTTAQPNGYSFQSGTSMSVPVVSAAAALVWGIAPQLTAPDVRQILENTADDLGELGRDSVFGVGRVNVYRAVLAARDTLWCPSDLNYSGGSTEQDLFEFLSLFFAGDLRADADRNGVLSVGDVFLFLTTWFSIC